MHLAVAVAVVCACRPRGPSAPPEERHETPEATSEPPGPTELLELDPGADADGDGIPNAEDMCPTEPETPNGFDDGDGCPDDDVNTSVGGAAALPGVSFASGSAEITAKAETVLDTVVEALKEFPRLRVEVSGHTDTSECRGAKCVDLGLARAQAVQEFLADSGIDPKRVEVRSAGADEPIEASSDPPTSADRKRNRRIEFTSLSE